LIKCLFLVDDGIHTSESTYFYTRKHFQSYFIPFIHFLGYGMMKGLGRRHEDLHKAEDTIIISELIIKGVEGSIYFMFICTFLKLLLYYITHINYSNFFIFKFHLLFEGGEIKDEGGTLCDRIEGAIFERLNKEQSGKIVIQKLQAETIKKTNVETWAKMVQTAAGLAVKGILRFGET
ncbi:hypothetical protein ACJX0J_020326, partial [Zea mays]